MFNKIFDVLYGIAHGTLMIFLVTWWILLPIVLSVVFWDTWIFYIRSKYIRAIKWVLLEIKIPREVLQTPRSMEEIFNSFHAIYSHGFHWTRKYLMGDVEQWLSLEFVGMNQGVALYLRAPEAHRNLIESAIYAQYANAEVRKVDDYLDLLPQVLPNKEFDLFGAELALEREDGYPIKTYPIFEAIEEEKRIDPVSTIVEVMSKLKDGEFLFSQILISPVGDEWKKSSDALRDKLLGREDKKKTSGGAASIFSILSHEIVEFFQNFIIAFNEPPAWTTLNNSGEKKEESTPSVMRLSPGEREVIEAIEQKSSKLAFKAAIRLLYIDRRASFTRSNVSSMFGAFRHYNTVNLNALRVNLVTSFSRPVLFKSRKLHFRKRTLFDYYRLRRLPLKMSIFNTEELATMYHPPIVGVEAPKLTRLAAKKGEPPAELPISD